MDEVQTERQKQGEGCVRVHVCMCFAEMYGTRCVQLRELGHGKLSELLSAQMTVPRNASVTEVLGFASCCGKAQVFLMVTAEGDVPQGSPLHCQSSHTGLCCLRKP